MSTADPRWKLDGSSRGSNRPCARFDCDGQAVYGSSYCADAKCKAVRALLAARARPQYVARDVGQVPSEMDGWLKAGGAP